LIPADLYRVPLTCWFIDSTSLLFDRLSETLFMLVVLFSVSLNRFFEWLVQALSFAAVDWCLDGLFLF